MTKFPEIFHNLSEPFSKEEIKILPKGKGLQYVTARTVMNRLDVVVGPENWWDCYREPNETSVVCSLTIRLPDGSIVTKSDAGGAAGMADAGDDDKSTYSDAFKRAAVKFGVGRHLYRDGIPSFEATHHVANFKSNDTGHGSGRYAPGETVKAFRVWLEATCQDANAKWSDKWTDKETGEIDARIFTWKNGELINTFQLSGHIVKWGRAEGLIEAPENYKPDQRDKLAAVAWERFRERVEAETRAYLRKEWVEIAGKVQMPKAERPAAAPEPEDESQEADDVLDAIHGDAYEGDLN